MRGAFNGRVGKGSGGGRPAPPVVTTLAEEALVYPDCSIVLDPDTYRVTYANGAPVTLATDTSGNVENYEQTNPTLQPTFVTTSAQLGSHASVSFDGTEFMQQQVGHTGANLITASVYTIFAVVYLNAIANNSGPDNSPCIFYDSFGWWGMPIRSGSGGLAGAWNWPSTPVEAACPIGQALVLCARYESNTLYASSNGGAESSGAGVNVGSLTGPVFLGSSATGKIDGQLGGLVGYKGNLGGPAARAAFITTLKARYGIA